MKVTEQMLTLVDALPEPDRVIATNLIEKRDFETLLELVISAIIKTERNLNTDSPKEIYINANLTNMITLLSITDDYLLASEDLEGICDINFSEEDELIIEEGEE